MSSPTTLDLQLWQPSARIATKYRFSDGGDEGAALTWMDKNRSAGLLDLVETPSGSFHLKVRTRWVPVPTKIGRDMRKMTAAERARTVSREKLIS